MALTSVSALSLKNNQQIKFTSNNNASNHDKTAFKNDGDSEKREAVKKQVRKIYNKGVITGAILVTAVFALDYLGEYFANKHFNKVDTSSLDTVKDTEKIVSDIHIPFKWILGKVKK